MLPSDSGILLPLLILQKAKSKKRKLGILYFSEKRVCSKAFVLGGTMISFLFCSHHRGEKGKLTQASADLTGDAHSAEQQNVKYRLNLNVLTQT